MIHQWLLLWRKAGREKRFYNAFSPIMIILQLTLSTWRCERASPTSAWERYTAIFLFSPSLAKLKKYPARIVPTVLTVCLRRILILSVIPADVSSIFPIIRILPYINSWTRTLTERLRSAALFFTAYAKNVRERSEQIAASGQTKAKKQSQK